jgi:heme exporter protein D
MIVLTLWLPLSIACGQTDSDDYASVGEWIFLAVLTAIGTSLVLLVVVVWHQCSNPHTGLLSRVKRRRARGPLRGGRLS